MKAPFGKGDIVEKFKMCPKGNNVFPVGLKTICLEVDWVINHGEHHYFRALAKRPGYYSCSCCFRLYNPPPQDKATTDNKAKVGHDA